MKPSLAPTDTVVSVDIIAETHADIAPVTPTSQHDRAGLGRRGPRDARDVKNATITRAETMSVDSALRAT